MSTKKTLSLVLLLSSAQLAASDPLPIKDSEESLGVLTPTTSHENLSDEDSVLPARSHKSIIGLIKTLEETLDQLTQQTTEVESQKETAYQELSKLAQQKDESDTRLEEAEEAFSTTMNNIEKQRKALNTQEEEAKKALQEVQEKADNARTKWSASETKHFKLEELLTELATNLEKTKTDLTREKTEAQKIISALTAATQKPQEEESQGYISWILGSK